MTWRPLGTPDEQRSCGRALNKRIEDYLAAHPDDPDLAEMREKHRLMKGVMYWRLSASFKARLWNERRSVKELEAELQGDPEACGIGPPGTRFPDTPVEYRGLRGARGRHPCADWTNCNNA